MSHFTHPFSHDRQMGHFLASFSFTPRADKGPGFHTKSFLFTQSCRNWGRCALEQFKGVLIDFKAPSPFVDLRQVYLSNLSLIHYLESLDGILPIFIVEIRHLIKANQLQSLSLKSLLNRLGEYEINLSNTGKNQRFFCSRK